MPRPLRPIAEGLVYHVINRGNNRQNVFRKESDYHAFLKALFDLKERKPFELYGYCLMSNHFHLLIRPRGATISRIVLMITMLNSGSPQPRHSPTKLFSKALSGRSETQTTITIANSAMAPNTPSTGSRRRGSVFRRRPKCWTE